MPTPELTPDRLARRDAAIDAMAARVAARIPAWFAERPVWLASELRSRAWTDHINIEAWFWHPTVRASGLRGISGMVHDGNPATFYVVVETEGEES